MGGVLIFVLSTIFGACVGYYFTTKAQDRSLANELGRVEGKLQEVEHQRDALQNQASNLQVEIAGMKAKSPLLDRYGSDFTLYRRWDPYQDPKQPLTLGRCEGQPCIAVQFEQVVGQGPTAAIRFSLVDRAALLKPLTASLPLRKGCAREIGIRGELLEVTVEDDSAQAPAIGFVVGAATAESTAGSEF